MQDASSTRAAAAAGSPRAGSCGARTGWLPSDTATPPGLCSAGISGCPAGAGGARRSISAAALGLRTTKLVTKLRSPDFSTTFLVGGCCAADAQGTVVADDAQDAVRSARRPEPTLWKAVEDGTRRSPEEVRDMSDPSDRGPRNGLSIVATPEAVCTAGCEGGGRCRAAPLGGGGAGLEGIAMVRVG
jgi:hypothetical protein